jgi:predicted XRE-type DNA-binding protein
MRGLRGGAIALMLGLLAVLPVPARGTERVVVTLGDSLTMLRRLVVREKFGWETPLEPGSFFVLLAVVVLGHALGASGLGKRLLAQADLQIDESILLKQQLMDEIARWIRETSVTQAVAAEVLHVTRPRVSDVVNHKTNKFTLDALVGMLARIGKHVRLAVQ